MCLRRAPKKYITGAALDRAVLEGRSYKTAKGGVLNILSVFFITPKFVVAAM
jgi:hypothetical protein